MTPHGQPNTQLNDSLEAGPRSTADLAIRRLHTAHHRRRHPQVYATARTPERMQGLEGFGCTLIELDVTNQQSIDAAVDQVLHEEPLGPDILVNNAGAALGGPIVVR
jgi:NADP-dependent 3-hydroxy acid dehydrogenase YdfG